MSLLTACILAACSINREPLSNGAGDTTGSPGAGSSGITGGMGGAQPIDGTGGGLPGDGTGGAPGTPGTPDDGTGGVPDDGTGGSPTMPDYPTANPLNVTPGSTQGSCPNNLLCSNTGLAGWLCSEFDGSAKICFESSECSNYGPDAMCQPTPAGAYCFASCTP